MMCDTSGSSHNIQPPPQFSCNIFVMMLENLHFGLNYSLAELSETHDFKIGLEYFVFLVSVGAAFGETSFGVMCGGS